MFDIFICFLNALSTKECLTYNNSTWISLINWFNNAIDSNLTFKEMLSDYLNIEFNKFMDESNSDEFTLVNSSSKFAKLFLIFSDTNNLKIYQRPLEAITDKLVNCNKYIYMNGERVEKCLFIFDSMLGFTTSNLIIMFQIKLNEK